MGEIKKVCGSIHPMLIGEELTIKRFGGIPIYDADTTAMDAYRVAILMGRPAPKAPPEPRLVHLAPTLVDAERFIAESNSQ